MDWQTDGEFPLPYTTVEVRLHGVMARRVYVDGEKLATSDQQFKVGKFQKLRIDV